jgi:hypothetical protein
MGRTLIASKANNAVSVGQRLNKKIFCLSYSGCLPEISEIKIQPTFFQADLVEG